MGSDIWALFRFTDLARDCGILPVAGGALDQTQSFLDAWDLVRQEEARYKSQA